jgi:hypothetical protein
MREIGGEELLREAPGPRRSVSSQPTKTLLANENEFENHFQHGSQKSRFWRNFWG